ncbi:MAG: hypothetical protein A2X56_08060 [Nitrospirae bacterium GWC2_57_13]|jgi:uncharacterized protein|nr:MAG: hypothetical protein A2X56_08060 [Nitrospirae bacterium GWC2_57_13]OGW46307.1 MAG: hypothetical protein A2X57_12835 [Nitrospirae bacterium GWD2_57_8]HAR46563.1 hypothetical protein [Nitrospiraceae bacterium]
MKTAVNILIAVIVLIIALSFILVYANTHPPRYPLHIPPSEYGVAYESVTFTTDDGIVLAGWIIEPPRGNAAMPAVVICHGVGANKSDFSELGASLVKRGFMVLLFDFRAHGESKGRRTSLGHLEQKDIAAALNFIKSRPGIDSSRIGIYGFSMGGAAAILSAARAKGFAAVVADSAFTSLRDQARDAVTGFYHLPAFPFLHLSILGYELYFQTSVSAISPEEEIKRLAPVPLLIIAGDGDRLIPAENGRLLYRAAGEPKELWVIPGADHGGTLVAAGPVYEQRVGQFFERHLKGRR